MGRFLRMLLIVSVVGVVIGLLLPAVQTRHHGKGRQWQSASNLRQIALGLLAYSNQSHHFPPGAVRDAEGKPLHGWPTLILPYVDNVEAYNGLNLARPWDDPTAGPNGAPSNRTITQTGIGIYRNPGIPEVPVDLRPVMLNYATNAWVIGDGPPRRLDSITDGLAQTLLGGEAAGNYHPWGYPVPWRDPNLGINQSPSGFGSPFDGGANFMFADGSVRFLRNETPMTIFHALATPDGGESVAPADFDAY